MSGSQSAHPEPACPSGSKGEQPLRWVGLKTGPVAPYIRLKPLPTGRSGSAPIPFASGINPYSFRRSWL